MTDDRSVGNVDFVVSFQDNKPPQRKRIVLVSFVVVVFFVLAVLALILVKPKLVSNAQLAGLNELIEYVSHGDAETRGLFEDEEENVGEDALESSEEIDEYIMAIRISEKGETEVKKYYEKLLRIEQVFYSKSAMKADSELLAEYGNSLKILRNAINYNDMREKLINVFEKGGEQAAKVFISENFECNQEFNSLAKICELEKEYYIAALSEHKAYTDAGCYVGGEYDMECAWDHYGFEEFEKLAYTMGNASRILGKIYSDDNLTKTNEEVIITGNNLNRGRE